MSKFEIGQRVAFYESNNRGVGIVEGIEGNTIGIIVGKRRYFVHKKQVRKLVKKKKLPLSKVGIKIERGAMFRYFLENGTIHLILVNRSKEPIFFGREGNQYVFGKGVS